MKLNNNYLPNILLSLKIQFRFALNFNSHMMKVNTNKTFYIELYIQLKIINLMSSKLSKFKIL